MSTPSLLCVPYRLKAGTLYSQIPDSGLGDFTVTRSASNSATRVNAAGFIETVADNVPRLDYPLGGITAGCPALLVEPAATNGIRNNSMVGASVSGNALPTNWALASAGLTSTIIATGSESGVQFVDIRLNGNATGTLALIEHDSNTQIVASNGQTWTYSAYVKVVSAPAPAGAYRINIREFTSAGGTLAEGTSDYTPTSSLARYSATRTLSGGPTVARVAGRLYFTLAIGSAYDFTIRIGYPQMEQSSVATSVIPTTTAAITRGAETISKTGLSSLIGQTEGTIYAEFEHTSNTAERRLIALSDGTSANRIFIWATSNILYAQIQGDNVIIANPIPSGYNKVAFAYQQNGVSGNLFASINGGAVVSGTSTTYPSTLSRVVLGSRENAAVPDLQWNNRIRAHAIYPTRLTNAQLQSLTQ